MANDFPCSSTLSHEECEDLYKVAIGAADLDTDELFKTISGPHKATMKQLVDMQTHEISL
jgi:hypothetical protein